MQTLLPVMTYKRKVALNPNRPSTIMLDEIWIPRSKIFVAFHNEEIYVGYSEKPRLSCQIHSPGPEVPAEELKDDFVAESFVLLVESIAKYQDIIKNTKRDLLAARKKM